MQMSHSFRRAYAIALIVVLHGCTPTPIPMQVPHLRIGSPLADIPPQTFAIQVTDSREEKFVTVSKNRSVGDQPVASFIARTLAAELKRRGHKAVLGAATKAHVVIVGIVKQAALKFTPHTEAGIVIVDISVAKSDGTRQLLSKTYDGTYYKWFHAQQQSRFRENSEILRDIFNGALLNLVEDFTTDPDLLDGLQQIAHSR